MKPAYIIGGLIFLACVALGIYYLIPIPGQVHIGASVPGKRDVTHALAAFVLGIIVLLGARFAANSSKS